MRLVLGPGVTLSAEVLQGAIAACGGCDPCDDGSGSGGSGGDGSGSGDGVVYAAAGSCCYGSCDFGVVCDLASYSTTVPLCYCFTFPGVFPVGPFSCNAWNNRVSQIDNDFSTVGSPPTIEAACTWFGACNDRDVATATTFYPDFDPGDCIGGPSYNLTWGCDADLPGTTGYVLNIGFLGGGPYSGSVKYVCPSASTTGTGSMTLSLVADTTGLGFPATIALTPCAPDGFNKI